MDYRKREAASVNSKVNTHWCIYSLLFLSVVSSARAGVESLPKGKDYPVKSVYTGKPVPRLDLKDEFTRYYRTSFKRALQGEIVFAGEYVQTGWGCGGSCYVTAFINKRTGRALPATFFMTRSVGDICEQIIYMKKNSRLLVTYDTENCQQDGPSFYNYYELTAGKLKLIRRYQDPEKTR